MRGGVLAALADRVGARKEVSACAVAIDEVDDFELFDEVFGNAPVLVVIGLGKFKALKEFSPTEIYAGWVLTVLLVEVFDGIDICIANIRNFIHDNF